MTDNSETSGNGNHPPEVLRQARRDRWATPLATVAALLHVFTGVVVFGWFYFIAPRYKWELDHLGAQLSSDVIFQIGLSDLLVNYWYLLGHLFVPVPIISFVFHAWLARRLGLRWACVSVIAVAIVILSNAVLSYSILRRALPFGYGQGVYIDAGGVF